MQGKTKSVRKNSRHFCNGGYLVLCIKANTNMNFSMNHKKLSQLIMKLEISIETINEQIRKYFG